jgi:ADP-ribose pyrophosphatase YjhB (NUDIX family)
METKEQPEEAVRREQREEVGLELASACLAFARRLETMRQVELIYLCRPAAGAAPAPRSIEIVAVEWFRRDSLPPQLDAIQRRLIERALTA